MAFGVEELRVLRRALALALNPSPASAEDVQDCLRLAESLDEAMREGARMRAFLMADLARYRAALPGTAAGYLTLLEEALGAGYTPTPDDLTALQTLRGNPSAATLLRRCRPPIPASRTHLQALPGGLPAQASTAQEPSKQPRKKPAEKPAAPKPAPGPERTPAPKPTRPIPTPGEVFPRRKPTPPPPPNPPQQLAAG
ncbi:hypothetical protein IM697_42055 [Streptomyces ferrugineus]|uniref:Uncharacterized protein n=2 Tax=Streptomyces ferrugineus TaxID=1413221 RepID=A0A7M2T120_9ACTN|nr:hypothetical protein IM697_42055 [Streptomyces ferrugineus]